MKTLKAVNPARLTVLGQQSPEPGTKYVLNPCLIRDGTAFYNPLTEEAVLVEDEDKDRRAMVRRWFLVPEGFDMVSVAHLIRQRNLEALAKPSGVNSYTIFTTTVCNASCVYCFERGYKAMTMSDQTARDVAAFILKTRRNSQISIRWFGGEPLVNTKVMDLICSELQEKGVNFVSNITTNGDLLPDCSDEQIRLWRIRSAQFTLDDVGAEYDRIKGLKGAYERLEASIDRLARLGVHSSIRVHYDPEKGAEPCYRVADAMMKHKNLSMYCRILYGSETEKDYQAVLEFEDYLIRNGLMRAKFPAASNGSHCMADRRQHATIAPDGALSPCEHYAYGEHIYGSIYTRRQSGAILAKWGQKEKHVMTTCRSCPLYACCEKIVMCPAEGSCESGYRDYLIAQIRRALRRSEAPEGIRGATKEELAAMCGVC